MKLLGSYSNEELEQLAEKALIEANKSTAVVYPAKENIFRALELCPKDKIKLVIIAQDPYSDGAATGLCFESDKLNPSLRNIYTLMEKSLKTPIVSGFTSKLAQQGVLMLNTALTVEKGKPNSHKELWEEFTAKLLTEINELDKNIVFVLWGANAIKYLAFIDEKKHKVFASSHPSPFSCSNPCGKYGSFMESDVFNKINKYFKTKKESEILW